jgi:methionyl-tRNA synthetase
MAASKLFTTPIFYVNGTPHIGHAYSVVLCDFFARSARLRAAPARFTSGTDEHGFKVARAAAALNIAPRALCDQVSRSFRDTFARLDVLPDDFVRTTESRHALVDAAMWRRLERRGFISLSVYSGWYCVSDEAFVPDDAVVTGPDPADPTRLCSVSRDSGNVVERIDEPTYMFDMARLRDAVRAVAALVAVARAARRATQRGAGDARLARRRRCRSQCRAARARRLGPPVPRNAEHTIYVWLDALCNYLTVLSADTDAIVSLPRRRLQRPVVARLAAHAAGARQRHFALSRCVLAVVFAGRRHSAARRAAGARVVDDAVGRARLASRAATRRARSTICWSEYEPDALRYFPAAPRRPGQR